MSIPGRVGVVWEEEAERAHSLFGTNRIRRDDHTGSSEEMKGPYQERPGKPCEWGPTLPLDKENIDSAES